MKRETWTSEDRVYARGMERLVGVVQALSRAKTMEEIQVIVRSAARQMTGADGATFVLRDGDKCHYADEDAIEPLWKGMRFPLSACISGWAMLNRRPAVIADIYADSRIPHDAYRPTFVKSLAMVPIRTTEPIGAIGNYWAEQRVPTDVEVKLLQALADSTSVAVENIQTQAALQRSQDQLRHAQKMEAVGRLAGGVAHDFNNVLSVILTYCQFIKQDIPADAALRTDIEEVSKAAGRAARLTKQLLAFSRQQTIAPVVLELGEFFEGMDNMLRRLIGADVSLTLLPAADVWPIKADRGHIEQVLMNLAVNARDAMPQGGSLTIAAKNVELEADYAQSHLDVAPGQYVMLSVSDTGVGMDNATQARIFEPFFTTKEQGKGTGLGLATVFGVVKQNGGHIWVYSEPGLGTTFKIYLPRTHEGKAKVSNEPMADGIRGKETVLVVDDDDQVRAAAIGILRRNGYVVLEASNGGEALLVTEQHPARIHLLLTDVVLPRMSGRQIAERVTAQRPDVKVLFMSGYTDDAVLQHGILESDVAYLQKPITPDALGRKVRQVLDGVS